MRLKKTVWTADSSSGRSFSISCLIRIHVHNQMFHNAYSEQLGDPALRGTRGGWALQTDHLYSKNNKIMTLNVKIHRKIFTINQWCPRQPRSYLCVPIVFSVFLCVHAFTQVANWQTTKKWVCVNCKYEEPEHNSAGEEKWLTVSFTLRKHYTEPTGDCFVFHTQQRAGSHRVESVAAVHHNQPRVYVDEEMGISVSFLDS